MAIPEVGGAASNEFTNRSVDVKFGLCSVGVLEKNLPFPNSPCLGGVENPETTLDLDVRGAAERVRTSSRAFD